MLSHPERSGQNCSQPHQTPMTLAKLETGKASSTSSHRSKPTVWALLNTLNHSLFDFFFFFRSYNLNVTLELQLDTDLLNLLLDPHLLV